ADGDHAALPPDAHRDRLREEFDDRLSAADRNDAPAEAVHRRREEVVTTDEGFREIQLNGKQLVFLFMAATVVSVVIFLMGVLVGRGVQPDRPAQGETTAAAVVPDPAPGPPPQPAAAPAQPPAEPPAPA